jgi:RNA polymerase sigma-70 factor (ECF subfamily)
MSKETPVSDPDHDLVARTLAGDRRAFDELVARHAAPMTHLVRRYLRDAQEAEDVRQQALARAYEHIGSFREASTFRTWLYRIAINIALNHLRRAAVEAWEPLEDDVAFARTVGTTQLAAAELWRKVSGRLGELPPKQRLVFELRIFHDLSFEEVATLAGCSEESAKVNYHHAVRKLRGVFAENG